MTDTFDWAGLVHEIMSAEVTFGVHAASDVLSTRIEAAFVPVEQRDKAEALLYQRTNEYIQATARAEAAEAECLEQARLVGMSGERELALRAELERLTTQLAEARESERAAMTEVNGLKDALAQVPEFICRKCGRRQDGPTDNEARF